MTAPRQAVVICTRNRPADLRRTLDSIKEQHGAVLVVVVDASDAEPAAQNRRRTTRLAHSTYLAYPEAPSSARQRNFGVDHLPPSVEVVHFVDDDVTLRPGYFQHLTRALDTHPGLGGVGGILVEGGRVPKRFPAAGLFFLLHSTRPGRVLPSGYTTPAPSSRTQGTLSPVQWLSGCASSYRRAVFEDARFDPALSGYAMLEDLDFSYRVGQTWNLAAVPAARLVHRASPKNRHGPMRFARTSAIHRYWFIEKNLRSPLRKPAFWWSMVGRLLAVLTSDDKRKWAALRGLRQGIRTIWQRDHPLLRNP